ncbi:MAG: ABC transporter permease [Acidimicrobiia bacterium]|nr:ABC transporter permease [Acidimicrobiia bacterium]NNF89695.1 ABC transporter permease [Acidimicrobiia bacterium]NNL14190.1 ABC transporter permease [Acidimicrobiia bacterium]NNL96748.1 ABC transporter permease [Acidimicrobiia bacterium]
MLSFIIRRTLLAIPVLIGIIVVVFFLIRAIPGDPCTAILGEQATEEACERFDEANGLNEPIFIQLGIYMKNVVTFDLGDSIRFSRPVNQLLIERLPLTIELAVSALAIAVAIGVPLGVLAARHHNTAIDTGTMAFANVGVSMPVFWLGLMLAYVFALVLKDTAFALPPSGRLSAGIFSAPYYEVWGWELTEGGIWAKFHEFIGNHYIFNSVITGQWDIFRDAVRHMILPAVALATIPLAIIARITRSSLLEVMGKDYIRTARAKGAREKRVVRRHALRNSLLPVVTIIGLQMGLLLGGAVLTETVFNLAGVGRALFDAITGRDYAIVQGFTVIIAAGYVLVNLLVDLSYAYLDPRIRVE